MAVPVVLTTSARPITPVESGAVPMTPVDTLGEPVTVVDAGGEPVVLVNEDGTPAFLAYSAKTYLGGVAPYHWLDFINNRALYAGIDVGNVTQATGYSFSRASTGYYQNADGTLTSFGSGALRRGDRGVLIEGARTNLCLQSQTFGTTWTLSNATISSDQTAAPDGTTTADKLVSAVGTSIQQIQQGIFTTNTNAHSFSVFVKAAGFGFVRVRAVEGTTFLRAVFIDVNLTTGASVRTSAVNGATLNASSVTALANGWYLVSLNYTLGGVASSSIPQVFLNDGTDSFNVTGNGTDGIFVWGAQVEAASFPSSYIPTTSASATRAADVLAYTMNGTAELAAIAATQAELVTNGEFATDTSWTKVSGATISGGVGNFAATGDKLQQSISLTNNAFYLVTIGAVTGSGGGIRLGQDASNTATFSAAGSYLVQCLGTSGVLTIRANAAGTIDNVSVKAIPANTAALYPLSMWGEGDLPSVSSTDRRMLGLYKTSIATDSVLMTVGPTGTGSVTSYSASAWNGQAVTAALITSNNVFKLAGRVNTNTQRACVNGTLGADDATVTLPVQNPDVLAIGIDPSGGGNGFFGYIRRAAVFNSALTDAQLQTVST